METCGGNTEATQSIAFVSFSFFLFFWFQPPTTSDNTAKEFCVLSVTHLGSFCFIIKDKRNLKAAPQFLMYLFVGQGPGLGLVGRGVAATQRRQVLHDGVQRLLLDCRAENKGKKSRRENNVQENSGKRLKDVWLSLKSRKGKKRCSIMQQEGASRSREERRGCECKARRPLSEYFIPSPS